VSDSSSRIFGIILILVAVWIGTYWLWEPRSAHSAQSDALAKLAPGEPLPAQSENPVVVEPPRADLTPLPTMTAAHAEQPKVEPTPSTAPKQTLGAPLTRRVQKTIKPEMRDYVVQKGDVSWQAIAGRREVYGDSRMWRAVSQANPLVTSDRLKPGVTKLKIAVDPTNIQGKTIWVDEPVVETASAVQGSQPGSGAKSAEPAEPVNAAPAKAKVTRYTIKADDTLWSIAKKFYGQGNEWRRIADANKEVIPNPDRPAKGVTIVIPDAPDGPDDAND
jgi:nucleoid-associated protein YgaU